MKPPIRNRINSYLPGEETWLIENQYSADFEYNIPALDKLKENIINEYLLKDNKYSLREGDIIPMIMKFYSFIDDLNQIFSKYSPCKKGCSSCCEQHVAITDIEIFIINNYIKTNNLKYKQIRPEKILCENKYKEKYKGKKCPFLNKNNECYIYPVRPLTCRRYIVFENDNSKCKCTNKIDISTMADDYVFVYIYHLIIKYFRKINGQDISINAIRSSFSDIRENFLENN